MPYFKDVDASLEEFLEMRSYFFSELLRVYDGNAQEKESALALMFGDIDHRAPRRVKFGELARSLGVSEEVVRYNVRKLVDLGYIVSRGKDVGYELTEKVIFLGESA